MECMKCHSCSVCNNKCKNSTCTSCNIKNTSPDKQRSNLHKNKHHKPNTKSTSSEKYDCLKCKYNRCAKCNALGCDDCRINSLTNICETCKSNENKIQERSNSPYNKTFSSNDFSQEKINNTFTNRSVIKSLSEKHLIDTYGVRLNSKYNNNYESDGYNYNDTVDKYKKSLSLTSSLVQTLDKGGNQLSFGNNKKNTYTNQNHLLN